jgi:hypothetical protein
MLFKIFDETFTERSTYVRNLFISFGNAEMSKNMAFDTTNQ